VTNPKENTDLREQIADKLHELRRSVQRDPLSTTTTEWAIQDIEKLVHQARENAVEECQRMCEAEQEKLHQSLMRFADEQYKKGFAEGMDMAQELESKEEA
jgi:hypothetical protein